MTSYPVGPKAQYAVAWRTCDARPADGAVLFEPGGYGGVGSREGEVAARITAARPAFVADAIHQRFPRESK